MDDPKKRQPAPPEPSPQPEADAPITLTLSQLRALMADVKADQPDSHALAKAITDGMAQVKEPIPEQKIHHAISAANPLGEKDHPRPGLKCEMWFGLIIDEKEGTASAIKRWYRIEPDDLTAWEQIALNLLEPIEATVQMTDDADMLVRVVADRHFQSGALQRLTIAIPFVHAQKGSQTKNNVPSIPNLVAQLTGVSITPKTLPPDKLGALMAKHRKKEYVAA